MPKYGFICRRIIEGRIDEKKQILWNSKEEKKESKVDVMNVKEVIVPIEISQIYPHPDNPRKDLGDLTELVESIKKNGIMQNLTVIPGHWLTDDEIAMLVKIYQENPDEETRVLLNKKWIDEGYTLIIGHRRHAASKLAGVRELPCRIIEGMTEKEQVSTMLEENMQRNDLTIYEQAQGFQMMLDLGETEQGIAEKTGFSRSTIRHRLNIANRTNVFSCL